MSTLQDATHDIKKTAAPILEGAGPVLRETLERMGKMTSVLRGVDVDDVLGWVGLKRRSSLGVGLGFASGVVVGAGAALLLTPISGAEMRERIFRAMRSLGVDVKGATGRADSAATVPPTDARKDEKADAEVNQGRQKHGASHAHGRS